jgi:hypothetical protein
MFSRPQLVNVFSQSSLGATMAIKKHHVGIGAGVVALVIAAIFAFAPTKTVGRSAEQLQAGTFIPALATTALRQAWSEEWSEAHHRFKDNDQPATPSF